MAGFARSVKRKEDPAAVYEQQGLMRKKYYASIKYGHARGIEAIHYVRRIRDDVDIIE